MKILVINSGSSSIKASLFDFGKIKEGVKTMSAHVDGINLAHCKFTIKSERKNMGLKTKVKTHEQGVKLILENLLKIGLIKNLGEIKRVGHRVVHGGEKYKNPVKIDAKVMADIKKFGSLAPLHNPVNLESIRACKKLLPKSKHVAIFDTAYYGTIPQEAYLYGLPLEMYEKHNIRRYGFHGTSHKYVVNKAIKYSKKKNLKIISCHLGNGSSITASSSGKAIDTSMGLTPLEGVLMGTRSGTIDPAIIFHLAENLKMKIPEIKETLNNKSGLLGISGISSDMREIYEASLKGDKRAILAIEILSYQIAKCCGGFAAALNGADILIFTGGLGEKAFYVRKKVCAYLTFLGLKIDKRKNEKAVKSGLDLADISAPRRKSRVFVIETDEEKQIAEEAKSIK